jgi:glycerate dehydrogenase
MRGVILDADSFDRGDLDLASLTASVDHWEIHRATHKTETLQRIAGFDVIVTNKVVINSEAMASPGLQLIVVAATGTNNIDLASAKARGVPVCNVRDYASGAVSQHVFSLILALTTRLHDYAVAVREGRWQKSDVFCLLDHPIGELEGLTLGIIGHGNLGQRVATIARGFGMEVLISARPGRSEIPSGRVPLEVILEQSDVISLHCPLNEHTKDLISAPQLRAMKSTALLINTARGGIINEHDLAEALRAGDIAAAGIDVLTQEPPPANHPLLANDIPNLIVSPHNAWGSVAARQRLANEIARLITAFRSGHPANLCLP